MSKSKGIWVFAVKAVATFAFISIVSMSLALLPFERVSRAEVTVEQMLSWEVIGFTDDIVETVEVDPNDNSVMYAALAWGTFEDNGIWKTTNSGSNWSKKLNASMYGASVDPRNSSNICAVGEDIYTSNDGGTSWNLRKEDNQQCNGITRDPDDADVLYAYAEYGNIYKSTNNGTDWSDVGLPVADNVMDLAVDPGDSSIIYATAWGSGVFKSNNGGNSWTPCNNGLPMEGTPTPDGLDAVPSQSGHLYLAFKWRGIFETTNGAASWNLKSSGLPSSPATTEVLVKRDETDVIYAGLDDSCYASIDGADTWTEQSASLTSGINRFACDPGEPDVLYGTGFSGGLYKASWVTPPETATWYLAEGSTDWGFSTYISIMNPNETDVTADITYMTSEGPESRESLSIPAESQVTIDPSYDIGAADFSTEIVCKEGKRIAVDRTMYWIGPTSDWAERHCSIGVNSPNKTWYLAEGSSAWNFECWLLIQNPNSQTATCRLTYMIEGAGPVDVIKEVPANSRRTYNMADDIGQKDASIRIEANVPVIPERAMYRNNRREGHNSIGTTAPSTDYYLAEGTTAWGFTTYVLIQNPNPVETSVSVTYMTSDQGPIAQPAFLMPANSRKTIKVNDVLPEKDFSTKVQGSSPIIAERAMYWNSGFGEVCHDSIGMSSAHSTFYLPDGETSSSAETWTLVQNPNDEEVVVRIDYFTEGAYHNISFTDTIPANSRRTYNMADKLSSTRSAVQIRCTSQNKKIMAERAMYWNGRTSGTDTIGGFSD